MRSKLLRSTTFTSASLALLLALGACRSDNKTTQQDALAQDSSLTRDLQLANRDTTAQPQLKDVPTTPPPAPPVERTVTPQRAEPSPRPAPHRVATATPQPRRETPPAPTPRAEQPLPQPVQTTASGNTVERGPAATGRSEGRVGVVAAGTTVSLRTGQRACTNTNTVGDRITAALAEPLTASNGVVVPAGATAVLEITSLQRSGQAGENMNIGLVLKSITYDGRSYPVDGEITYADVQKVRASDNHDAEKVGGGAVVGAILGRVLNGRNKTAGTIIGAAGGAAAGAVIASQTAKYDACIPSDGRVTVRLDAPLSVQAPTGTATNSAI